MYPATGTILCSYITVHVQCITVVYCVDQPISTGTTTVSTITDTAATQVKDTVDHDNVRYQMKYLNMQTCRLEGR